MNHVYVAINVAQFRWHVFIELEVTGNDVFKTNFTVPHKLGMMAEKLQFHNKSIAVYCADLSSNWTIYIYDLYLRRHHKTSVHLHLHLLTTYPTLQVINQGSSISKPIIVVITHRHRVGLEVPGIPTPPTTYYPDCCAFVPHHPNRMTCCFWQIRCTRLHTRWYVMLGRTSTRKLHVCIKALMLYDVASTLYVWENCN